MDLFDHKLSLHPSHAPLADRMRPTSFDDFVGQDELLGEQGILRKLLIGDKIPSMIFWGPPGSGKTTLAHIIAQTTQAEFISLSAVSAGVKDLKSVTESARDRLKLHNKRTIVFVDEIHRWNKSQQDVLLPYVENGTVTLIGATTENPSFEINTALLSRSRVFVLKQLAPEYITQLLERALQDVKQGLGSTGVSVGREVLEYIAHIAGGDARVALNALELGVQATAQGEHGILEVSLEAIQEILQKSHHLYDKTGEQHHNIISALHKSLRGSDANAALYWLGRMLESGEDPLFIARRLVRFASEDIGLANSRALEQAVAGYQACHMIGMPECNVILAQVVVYLAQCKKSNALYSAYQQVQEDVKNTQDEPVPLHLCNAPTKLMKNLDYGKGYKYSPDHDYNEEQDYLPESLKGKKYL